VNAAALLEVHGLTKRFPLRRGWLRRPHGETLAVEDASFSIAAGETLALVGGSGSGKTTLARALLRLIEPSAGRVLYRRGTEVVDLRALRGARLRAIRRELGIVFQDPYQSMNPRLPVGEALAEPLRVHGVASRSEAARRAAELLERVGLEARAVSRYPHEFSGGQRQRIAIARALALRPRFVVLDEAVSSLDVSVQAQILGLLRDLRAELGLAYLFISHDLALVRVIAERVAVMERGRIVECDTVSEVLTRPSHAATRALLASVPSGDPRRRMPGMPAPGR